MRDSSAGKANILLVDDHPENLLALEATLESLGQNLIRAGSGEEALRQILKHEFAVILLDVHMPELDGFETAVLIRERDRSKQTPLIFVTAVSTSEAYIFKGYSLGAVDYILKPFAAEILRSKVSVFVDLHFKNLQIQEQAERLRLAQKVEHDRGVALLKERAQAQMEERIANIVEIASDAIITISRTKRTVQVFNKGAEGMFGLAAGDVIGKNIDSILPGLWMEECREGKPREMEARRADGTSFPAEASCSILEQDGGTFCTLILRDISERRRTEEELSTFARKLGEANRELRDLLMAASHDLQEPLRRIEIFSDRLMTKHQKEMPEAIAKDVLKMHNSAIQMHHLIADLLAYSKVTGQPDSLDNVDLEVIAGQVLADFEPQIEEAGARIEVGSLPSLTANKLQMRQLLQNLIGNSIKFRSKDRPLTVKITSMVDGHECEIKVEDNGIGFDQKYLPKIFSIFERLHSRDDYEGTGVGLAICRKIVERHSGTITAEGRDGKGASFILRLPLKQS